MNYLHNIATKVKKITNSRRFWYEVLFLVVTLIVSLFSLSLLYQHSGWPSNHEGKSIGLRVSIYAEHFKQGDLFPIWSSSDAYDLGTPMPLYYQKTFNYVGAILYLIAGQIKLALVLALLVFFLIAAYGMRAATKQIINRPALKIIVPQAFLLSNYFFTDWLVRGAVAELSALAFVAWLIYWAIILIKTGKFSYSIIPIFFLLFYSHNAIAMAAIIMLLVAGTIFLVKYKWAGFKQIANRLVISIGSLVILIVPALLLQARFDGVFAPAEKISPAGYLANNFHTIGEYFYDRSYTWLAQWNGHMQQIDFGIWIPIAVLILVILGLEIYRHFYLHAKAIRFSPVTLFLAISFSLFLILQLQFTTSFYEHTPLYLIQFPWRLLVFMTPLGLLLIFSMLSDIRQVYDLSILRNKKIVGALLTVWLALFLAFSPVWYIFGTYFMDLNQFVGDTTHGSYLVGGDEYMARTYKTNGEEVLALKLMDLYSSIAANPNEINKTNGCIVDRVTGFEALEQTYVVTCDAAQKVVLPAIYAPYYKVDQVISTTETKQLSYERLPTDPRIIVNVPAGETVLLVHVPTVNQVFGSIFQKGN